MRGDHHLRTETVVARPRSEVFAFFAAAENLQRITPPELNFEILTPTPVGMQEGTRIDYLLRLFGLPFTWQTLISRWEPDDRFVDEQIRGPYARWIHTHSFEPVEGGTLVRDEVLYRLPLYPLGEVGWPVVRLQLRRIFRYRAQRLRELLGPPDPTL